MSTPFNWKLRREGLDLLKYQPVAFARKNRRKKCCGGKTK
jgi:hypothetical protein